MENKIDILIEAIDQASSTIKKVELSVSNLERSTQKASKSTQQGVGAMGSAFGSLRGTIALAASAYTAFASTKALFKLTGYVEQAKIGFTTLLGSQEKALQMMKDIDVFAAKTPFEKVDLTPLVQQLLGMGFASEQALPVMNVLGDSMAALGRGKDDLQGVVIALGQMKTKGHLVQQELNQMAERGLPVFSILQEKLHLTAEQMGDIGKQGISATTAINALLTGLNEKFAGAMQRQNKTLMGQWSNVMDNVKSIVGNAGQDINKTVTGWLSYINSFFDKNRGVIGKFVTDILNDVKNMVMASAEVFGYLGQFVAETMAGISGDTERSTASQAQSWSQAMMYISGAWIGLMGTIKVLLIGFVGMVRIASNLIITTLIGVAGVVGVAVAAMLTPITTLINLVIDGVNRFSDLLGTKPIQKITFVKTMMAQSMNAIKYSVTDGAAEIGKAWDTMGLGIAETFYDSTNKIKDNIEQTKKAITKDDTKSDTFERINEELKKMKDNLDKTGASQKSAGDAAKAHKEELKKMKEMADDAIKPIIEKIKDEKKEIDDAKKKIIESVSAWKKYKEEAIKAISEVNNELVKLKKEASEISLQVDSDKDIKLGERLVDVYKEIEDKKKEIASAQMDNGDGSKSQDIIDMQNELLRLERERDYIRAHTPQQVIDAAAAYADLTRAEQIAADAEKEKSKALEENTAKQTALIEKRMILEAQANQKSITDMGIIIGMKDGMITASVLDEKGVRQEIHDEENIALAYDIYNKQAAYKKEIEDLTKTLQDKLMAQTVHIDMISNMYKEFNKFLDTDTAKTALSMTANLAKVNEELKATIRLRQQAGFNAPVAGAGVDGARKAGGPVEAGKSYLVGEEGPEIFTPPSNGSIIPNGKIGGGNTTINITMTGFTVRNDNDVKNLTNELTRQLELYKLGIA